jgi:hypothetical protein
MNKIKESRFYQNLKYQVENHPMEAIIVAGATALAVAKLMEANTNRKNAKTWEEEVERRKMKSM